MKVYKPVFTDHWIIEELESDDLRRLGKDTIISKAGTIYNDNFYTTRDGARKYICWDYTGERYYPE